MCGTCSIRTGQLLGLSPSLQAGCARARSPSCSEVLHLTRSLCAPRGQAHGPAEEWGGPQTSAPELECKAQHSKHSSWSLCLLPPPELRPTLPHLEHPTPLQGLARLQKAPESRKHACAILCAQNHPGDWPELSPVGRRASQGTPVLEDTCAQEAALSRASLSHGQWPLGPSPP